MNDKPRSRGTVTNYGDGRPHKHNPPKGGTGVVHSCNHNYLYLESEYYTLEGPGLNFYKQTDVFYCKKCLDYKKIESRRENSRGKPSWYKEE